MNIALIGMMGTMKTSVGKVLAKKTNMRFLDTDAEYVKRSRMSINETFERKGEAFFREEERKIVKDAATESKAVIACGGGVPLDERNISALKASSKIVLLTATAERIYERTANNTSRPLLKNGGLERIKTLMAERKNAYESAADITVDTTDMLPEAVADRIIGILSDKS